MTRRPSRPFASNHSGFTILEIVIVMVVVAIILSVVMKSTNGMVLEGQLGKVEQEVNTLKSAVTSYWRNNGNTYPPNIHSALTSASPQILASTLVDPFHTDSTNNTYGYLTGTDSTFGPYFIVFTKGPRGDTTAPSWDATNQRVTYTGSGVVVSNAPVARH